MLKLLRENENSSSLSFLENRQIFQDGAATSTPSASVEITNTPTETPDTTRDDLDGLRDEIPENEDYTEEQNRRIQAARNESAEERTEIQRAVVGSQIAHNAEDDFNNTPTATIEENETNDSSPHFFATETFQIRGNSYTMIDREKYILYHILINPQFTPNANLEDLVKKDDPTQLDGQTILNYFILEDNNHTRRLAINYDPRHNRWRSRRDGIHRHLQGTFIESYSKIQNRIHNNNIGSPFTDNYWENFGSFLNQHIDISSLDFEVPDLEGSNTSTTEQFEINLGNRIQEAMRTTASDDITGFVPRGNRLVQTEIQRILQLKPNHALAHLLGRSTLWQRELNGQEVFIFKDHENNTSGIIDINNNHSLSIRAGDNEELAYQILSSHLTNHEIENEFNEISDTTPSGDLLEDSRRNFNGLNANITNSAQDRFFEYNSSESRDDLLENLKNKIFNAMGPDVLEHTENLSAQDIENQQIMLALIMANDIIEKIERNIDSNPEYNDPLHFQVDISGRSFDTIDYSINIDPNTEERETTTREQNEVEIREEILEEYQDTVEANMPFFLKWLNIDPEQVAHTFAVQRIELSSIREIPVSDEDLENYLHEQNTPSNENSEENEETSEEELPNNDLPTHWSPASEAPSMNAENETREKYTFNESKTIDTNENLLVRGGTNINSIGQLIRQNPGIIFENRDGDEIDLSQKSFHENYEPNHDLFIKGPFNIPSGTEFTGTIHYYRHSPTSAPTN